MNGDKKIVMNQYTLVHWSTFQKVLIVAINWDIQNYQHTFYQDDKGKIVQQSYTTRYWDLVDVKYNLEKNEE